MPSDRDMVSKEPHELNYLLQKWDKRQTTDNRRILADALDAFKHDDAYKPHNRKNFYRYVDDNNIQTQLEATADDSTRLIEKETPTVTGNGGVTGKKKKGISPGLIILLVILAVIVILLIIFFAWRCTSKAETVTDATSSTIEDTTTTVDELIAAEDEDVSLSQEDAAVILQNLITANTPIYFLWDRAVPVTGETVKLDSIIEKIDQYTGVKIEINGHTAEIGKPESEKKLSRKRAAFVKNYIEQKTTLKELVITTNGYGAENESVPKAPKDRMHLNRRVEITVISVR